MRQINKEVDFLILGILGKSLLGNMLAGKGVDIDRASEGIVQAGDGVVRSEQDF